VVYDRIQKVNQIQIRIIDNTNDYMRKIHSAILILSEMVDDLIDNNSENIQDKLNQISQFEREGEDMKNYLFDELATPDLFLRRGDFMRLVITINQIVDKIEGTAYRVKRCKNWKINDKVGAQVKKIMETLIKQIRITKEMIFTLTQNPKETLKRVKNVYALEQDIDKLRRDLMEELFDLDIDTKTLMQARDLLDGLENISNLSENVADATRIIAVGRRGAP